MQPTVIPEHRPAGISPGHFLTLDGLRGVAAFAVVVYHRRGAISPTIGFHGYLAVDFFFMLSGFVIAHAYWQRLARGELGFGQFVRLRAERLGPLVVLGVTLGTGVMLIQALAAKDHAEALGLIVERRAKLTPLAG